MRIIDAHALKIAISGRKDLNRDIAMRLVSHAPTVDAIPVEWLVKNYCYEDGRYTTESYRKRAKIVKEILKEWGLRNCACYNCRRYKSCEKMIPKILNDDVCKEFEEWGK